MRLKDVKANLKRLIVSSLLHHDTHSLKVRWIVDYGSGELIELDLINFHFYVIS